MEKMYFVYMFMFVIFVSVIYYKWKRRHFVRMVEKFQGPPALPIFGNILDVRGIITGSSSLSNIIEHNLKQYKSPCRLWLAHTPLFIISTPQDFQIVTQKVLKKAFFYKFVVEAFGSGILSAPVRKWKHNRKLLNPVFNPVFMKDYLMDIFNKQNQIIKENLKNKTGSGKHFDLWPYFIESSISTISKTAMGYQEENLKEMKEFSTAMAKFIVLVFQRFFQPWLYPSFIFKFYMKLKGYEKLFDIVHKYPLQGSESTSITACFLLLMLGMRQDIQEQAYKEQYEIFGQSERAVNLEDVSKMHFLRRCIKETLRRFPIAPFIARYASEDISIDNNYIIPGGSNIVLSIWDIHHDAKIYPDPLVWNPDNFTPENEASRHKCSFVPFSFGSRGCIGEKYAMFFLEIQLSILLRAYRIYTDVKMEEIELSIYLILRSKYGYNVRLEHRRK